MPMNPRLLVPRATFDPDAATYLRAVEAADGQALETPVKRAVDDFIRGMKADGTFSALKAACLLCGARTLAGALVPLKGAAPTNNNFVSGDYNRETGLVGNASTKYLDSNRNNNADPQNSQHVSAYMSALPSTGGAQFLFGAGGAENGAMGIGADFSDPTAFTARSRNITGVNNSATIVPGLVGISRADGLEYFVRFSSTAFTNTQASQSPLAANIHFFRRNAASPALTNARLAFYSIGEAIDLALLDTRVSALVTAIGAAI